MHIIKRDMASNKLPNFYFSQKTRVATPAAVLEWLAKYDPSGKAAASVTRTPRPRPVSQSAIEMMKRAERAIKRL